MNPRRARGLKGVVPLPSFNRDGLRQVAGLVHVVAQLGHGRRVDGPEVTAADDGDAHGEVPSVRVVRVPRV